jgi:hypothetical protein
MIDLKGKIKEGDKVQVEFFDHCEGGDGTLPLCRVYGEVRDVTKYSIRVCGWDGMGCSDDETIWTIALACVEAVVKLKLSDVIISDAY